MSERKKEALILMVKNPVLGHVKTRLAKDVGDAPALEVYLKLLELTSQTAVQTDADRFVFYSQSIDRADVFDNRQFRKYVQCAGDLGVRMDYAFSIPFKNEYKKVVIIGADCPDISTEHLQQAFAALDQHDFVIGPASDGGYYLLGMKKWNRWIFQEQPWSDARLLQHTMDSMSQKNATFTLLPELSDIDTLQDLSASSLSVSFPSLK